MVFSFDSTANYIATVHGADGQELASMESRAYVQALRFAARHSAGGRAATVRRRSLDSSHIVATYHDGERIQ